MAGRFMTKIYCKQARVFARTVKFSGSPGARRTTPALQGDACPDRFDKAETATLPVEIHKSKPGCRRPQKPERTRGSAARMRNTPTWLSRQKVRTGKGVSCGKNFRACRSGQSLASGTQHQPRCGRGDS